MVPVSAASDFERIQLVQQPPAAGQSPEVLGLVDDHHRNLPLLQALLHGPPELGCGDRVLVERA